MIVNGDILKLTAYFAERERTGGRFLAEGLLDLFTTPAITSSVMLRGIASFGPRNIVRTDESLSMSEDPPVMIAAIGAEPAIAAVVDDVVAMTSRGLITLERARLADGAMPDTGDDAEAVKMTLYAGRQQRAAGRPAHQAACEVFHRLGFAGATVFLGVDGTAGGQRRRARFLSRNVDVPTMTVAVGTAAQASSAAAELTRLLSDPLLTVERVRICKRDGRVIEHPHGLPATDASGLNIFQMLTVYTSEDSLHDGVPVHRALVRRLRETHQVSGATVLRGLWGFHGDHPPHGDKMLQVGRSVPVATIVVDTPAAIAHSFAVVDELTGHHGLVTSERVPARLALDGGDRHGGTRLAWG